MLLHLQTQILTNCNTTFWWLISAQFLLKLQVKYYLTLISLNILIPPPCLILINPQNKTKSRNIAENFYKYPEALKLRSPYILPTKSFPLALIWSTTRTSVRNQHSVFVCVVEIGIKRRRQWLFRLYSCCYITSLYLYSM